MPIVDKMGFDARLVASSFTGEHMKNKDTELLCVAGTVNAKNRLGGYVGAKAFVTLMTSDYTGGWMPYSTNIGQNSEVLDRIGGAIRFRSVR